MSLDFGPGSSIEHVGYFEGPNIPLFFITEDFGENGQGGISDWVLVYEALRSDGRHVIVSLFDQQEYRAVPDGSDPLYQEMGEEGPNGGYFQVPGLVVTQSDGTKYNVNVACDGENYFEAFGFKGDTSDGIQAEAIPPSTPTL